MGNPNKPSNAECWTEPNAMTSTQYRGTSTPNGGTVVHPHLPGSNPSLNCVQTSRLRGFAASSRLRGVFAASRLLRVRRRLRGFAASSRRLRGFAASSQLRVRPVVSTSKLPPRLHVSVAIVGATVWLTALISSDSSTPKISSYPSSTLSMVFVPARGTSTATHPKACRAISIVLWGPRVKIRLDGGSLKFGQRSARPEGRLGHRDDPVHVPTPNSSTTAPP